MYIVYVFLFFEGIYSNRDFGGLYKFGFVVYMYIVYCLFMFVMINKRMLLFFLWLNILVEL